MNTDELLCEIEGCGKRAHREVSASFDPERGMGAWFYASADEVTDDEGLLLCEKHYTELWLILEANLKTWRLLK